MCVGAGGGRSRARRGGAFAGIDADAAFADARVRGRAHRLDQHASFRGRKKTSRIACQAYWQSDIETRFPRSRTVACLLHRLQDRPTNGSELAAARERGELQVCRADHGDLPGLAQVWWWGDDTFITVRMDCRVAGAARLRRGARRRTPRALHAAHAARRSCRLHFVRAANNARSETTSLSIIQSTPAPTAWRWSSRAAAASR